MSFRPDYIAYSAKNIAFIWDTIVTVRLESIFFNTINRYCYDIEFKQFCLTLTLISGYQANSFYT